MPKWLSTLGKIGLQAAPYVAAPFTAGTSLYAVPATQKIGQAWSEHDNAERAKKGLGPSSVDKYINMGSSLVGDAAAKGAFGKLGTNKPGSTASGKSVASLIGGSRGGINDYPMNEIDWTKLIMNGAGGIINANQNSNRPTSPIGPSNSDGSSQGTGVARDRPMPRGGFSYNQNPLNQYNQSFPNLSEALHQGRQEAIMNQPFRGGYDVNTRNEDDDSVTTMKMPPMYPNNERRRRN